MIKSSSLDTSSPGISLQRFFTNMAAPYGGAGFAGAAASLVAPALVVVALFS